MRKYVEQHSTKFLYIDNIEVKINITKIKDSRGRTISWSGTGVPVNKNDSDKLRECLHIDNKIFTLDLGLITIKSWTAEDPLCFECQIRGRT